MNRCASNECWWFFGVICLLSAIVPASAHAQHFSFGFSTGHYHHHGPWGHCWGPPWWGPPFGVIYAPPPLVQERVIYVQPPPRIRVVAPANPAVASAAPALGGTPATESSTDSRITIRNAAGVRLPVSFLLDGQEVELADGAAQSFTGQARRTIRYDRGGHYGSTQQEITPGDYEFRVTASGWELVRRPDAVSGGRMAVRANALPPAR